MNVNKTPIELYTDGSCLNNPGPGGAAYLLRAKNYKDENDLDPQWVQQEKAVGYKRTTNNRMEILSVILGLEDIANQVDAGTIQNAQQINTFSDSKYTCDAVNQRWIAKWSTNGWQTSGFGGSPPKPVRNRDLWERLILIMSRLGNLRVGFTINHVAGHSGQPQNERCDQLAQGAARSNDLLTDEVYESQNKR